MRVPAAVALVLMMTNAVKKKTLSPSALTRSDTALLIFCKEAHKF